MSRHFGAPRPNSASLNAPRPIVATRVFKQNEFAQPQEMDVTQVLHSALISHQSKPMQASSCKQQPKSRMALIVSMCGPVNGSCTLVLRFILAEDVFCTLEGQRLKASAKQAAKQLCQDFSEAGLAAAEYNGELTFDQLKLLQCILSRRVGEWSPTLQLCAGLKEEKASWERRSSRMRTVCIKEMDLQLPDIEARPESTRQRMPSCDDAAEAHSKDPLRDAQVRCHCTHSAALVGTLEMLAPLLQGLEESLIKYQETRSFSEKALIHQCEVLARAAVEREQALAALMEESQNWADMPLEVACRTQDVPYTSQEEGRAAAENVVIEQLLDELSQDELASVGYDISGYKHTAVSSTNSLEQLGLNTKKLLCHAMGVLRQALSERERLPCSSAVTSLISDHIPSKVPQPEPEAEASCCDKGGVWWLAPQERSRKGSKPSQRERPASSHATGRPSSSHGSRRSNAATFQRGKEQKIGRNLMDGSSTLPDLPAGWSTSNTSPAEQRGEAPAKSKYLVSLVKQAVSAWKCSTPEACEQNKLRASTSEKVLMIRTNLGATVSKCQKLPVIAHIVANCQTMAGSIAKGPCEEDQASEIAERSLSNHTSSWNDRSVSKEIEHIAEEQTTRIMSDIMSDCLMHPEVAEYQMTRHRLEGRFADAVKDCQFHTIHSDSEDEEEMVEAPEVELVGAREDQCLSRTEFVSSPPLESGGALPVLTAAQPKASGQPKAVLSETQCTATLQAVPPMIRPDSVRQPNGSPRRIVRVVADGGVRVMPRPPSTPRGGVRPQREPRPQNRQNGSRAEAGDMPARTSSRTPTGSSREPNYAQAVVHGCVTAALGQLIPKAVPEELHEFKSSSRSPRIEPNGVLTTPPDSRKSSKPRRVDRLVGQV